MLILSFYKTIYVYEVSRSKILGEPLAIGDPPDLSPIDYRFISKNNLHLARSSPRRKKEISENRCPSSKIHHGDFRNLRDVLVLNPSKWPAKNEEKTRKILKLVQVLFPGQTSSCRPKKMAPPQKSCTTVPFNTKTIGLPLTA